MYKALNFLKQNLSFLLIIYLIVQLIYIVFFRVSFYSDSHYYYKLAEDCIKANSFYPAPHHLFEDYIIAPLYINLLVVVLKIYNSTFSIGLLNIILNFLQLFFLYKITMKIFNEDTAKLTIVMYIFYLNTLGLILLNYTELFFGVLIFTSIYFYLNEKPIYFLLSGLAAGASIGVRPTGWALLAVYLIFYLLELIKRRKAHKKILLIISGSLIFILAFGFFNQFHFGKFIYTSTTGPVNLLIGANDNSTGAFNAKVFEKGNAGYLENPHSMTYIEKEKYWKTQAINWIENHPVKWIALFPLKFGYMFLWDDISISALINLQQWDLFHIAKLLIIKKSLNELFKYNSAFVIIIYLIIQILNYLYYIFVLLFTLLGLRYLYKKKFYNLKNSLLLLFCILGILITVAVYGIPRYKYPFIISFLPFASLYLKFLMDKKPEKQFE